MLPGYIGQLFACNKFVFLQILKMKLGNQLYQPVSDPGFSILGACACPDPDF